MLRIIEVCLHVYVRSDFYLTVKSGIDCTVLQDISSFTVQINGCKYKFLILYWYYTTILQVHHSVCSAEPRSWILFYFSHMYYMHGHTYSKSMDQPGKVASPARGQLNRQS